MLSRRLFFLTPFILAHAVSIVAKDAPNIVMIVADDLGFNDISWHNQIVRSPNLEMLAREGVLLNQHYSQPICTPTRAALMSGRYPFHIGLQREVVKPLNPWGLLPNLTTLADEFKGAGYVTHIVGKWHLGFCKEDYLPLSRGFDHHYGFWVGSQDYYQHTRMDGYDFRDDMEVDQAARGEYSSTLFSKRAKEIITSHDQSSPLFLYLPFQAVHGPLEAPQEYVDLYEEVPDDDRSVFLGMVTAMDDAVGVIVDSLKQSNMYDNTIIVFFSDNGGAKGHGNNWPLRGHKSSLWEGGTRTPAFVRGPDLTPRVEEGIFHVTDWYPTLLAAIGKKPADEDLDGVNEWEALTNSTDIWNREEMVYNIKTLDDHPYSPVAAIRVGDWKYLWRVTGDDTWEKPPEGRQNGEAFHPSKESSNTAHTNQLFNLAEDPLEEENLAYIEEERALEMKERLQEHLKSYMDVRYNHDDPAGKPGHFGDVWTTGWC